MKVSDLTGAMLDMWVAKAEGLKASIEEIGGKNYCLQGDKCRMGYSPSSDWSQGGPIIEREKIKLEPIHKLKGGEFVCWNAKALPWMYAMEGETPLLAAMRAYVASKFGLEVEE